MHLRFTLSAALMLSACSEPNASSPDAAVADAAVEDAVAPTPDAAVIPVDASPRPDATTRDAGSGTPSVRRDATYRVVTSTHVYAQGLQHSIVHGTADTTVPFAEAEALRDVYASTGVAFDFHPLEGIGHGAWAATVGGMTLEELAMAFVVEQQTLTVTE